MRFKGVCVLLSAYLVALCCSLVQSQDPKDSRGHDSVAVAPAVAAPKAIDEQTKKTSDAKNKFPTAGNNDKNRGYSEGRNTARTNQYFLAKQPACAEDVKRICPETVVHNNFAVLDCIQNYKKTEESDLSPECHNLLWAYKRNSTKDSRFADAAEQVCGGEIEKLTDCAPLSEVSGHLLSCLMDAQENITNPQCKQFLTKMEGIVFSDYRLIYKFAESCDKDIEQLRCGRLDTDDNSPHSQGSTIECLSKNPKELSSACQHEILRIAELQSEDFHLDRPLFFACRDDRDRFCDSIASGDGRVYRCLLRHKMDKDFSQQCRDKLTQRQVLSAFDYKVNKGLAKSCRDDIRAYRCRDDTSKNREIRLAQILRCLENIVHKGYPVAGECQAEMLDHRRSLMEDFRLSPNVVSACKEEISKFCNERLEGNGRTIHCLMSHARVTTRKKKRISETCKRELEELVHQTDPGEDWRVDPVLKEACESVVNVACRDFKPGGGQVLSCLMDNVGSNHMTEDCEEKLLQIQYFVARDYRLDPRLYRLCQEDAKRFCNAGENWAEDPLKAGPERGPILPCLFRYTYHSKDDQQLTSTCNQEVKRVMRQRAVSVDLHPEIENACINELAILCLEKVNKGEELECLQRQLEKLSPDCQNAIGNYTEEEAEHIELNSLLFRACEPYVKQYCEEFLVKDVDEGDIIQCLISHKNENNLRSSQKCYTYLEHFQLISLKDYRFSFKFKESCKKDIGQHCKVRTKPQVIMCLSELVRNDTLQERKPRVSKECRQQLRVELFQRNEDIRLDPKLEEVCHEDRTKFCTYIIPGNAQVLECLKDNQKLLSLPCHRLLFNRQVKDTYDNGVDYVLMTVCRNMLKLFCDRESVDALVCLKENKEDPKFDPKCRGIVLKRMAQQNQDYRLNPQLLKACSMDVRKFCDKILRSSGSDDDRAMEGKVIACLKDAFVSQRLSPTCERQVGDVIKESQLDYRQDPVLAEACKNEITSFCQNFRLSDEDGKGEVEECLKVQFQTNHITNLPCRRQIAKLIQEGSADIHVDPILFKTCILDIHHFCANVPAGKGKQLKCLLEEAQKSGQLFQRECREMLEKRMQMFKSAAQEFPVENVQELVVRVMGSPARNYFFVVGFAIIGSIFIGGLFCGRVTKRVHYDMKRK